MPTKKKKKKNCPRGSSHINVANLIRRSNHTGPHGMCTGGTDFNWKGASPSAASCLLIWAIIVSRRLGSV